MSTSIGAGTRKGHPFDQPAGGMFLNTESSRVNNTDDGWVADHDNPVDMQMFG